MCVIVFVAAVLVMVMVESKVGVGSTMELVSTLVLVTVS
jgi:hypothetical protein